jgi:hypothetical protein
MALLKNIRLGRKGLPGINTTAYFRLFVSGDEKKFNVFDTGVNVMKHFFFVAGEDAKIS